MLIAILSFAVYFNGLSTPFQFDDKMYIRDNPNFADISDTRSIISFNPSMPRPVSNLTAAGLYAIFGSAPLGYHVALVMLHILNSALIGLIAVRLAESNEALGKSEYVFGATSLVMALHPLLTGSVTYISNLPGLEASFFMLMGLWLYMKAKTRRMNGNGCIIPYGLAILCSILALGSKEIAFVFPALILLVDLTGPASRVSKRKSITMGGPFWFLVLLVVHVRIKSGVPLFPVGASIGLVEHLKIQTAILPQEFALMLWPINLNLDRFIPTGYSNISGMVGGIAIIVLAMSALAALKYYRKGILFFGLGFVFANIAPFFLVPLKDEFVERNLYLPTAGMAIIAGAAISRLLNGKHRSATVILCIFMLVSYAGLTRSRNHVWQTEHAVWRDAYMKSPNNPRALNYMGALYIENDKIEKAYFVLDKAIKLAPLYAEAKNNMGIVYMRQGKVDEAMDAFDHSSRCDVTYSDPRRNLGFLLIDLERFDEAEVWLKKALELSPHDPHTQEALKKLFEARSVMGLKYLNSGNPEKAMEIFEILRKSHPASIQVTLRLATSCAAAGKYRKAMELYTIALNMEGADPLKNEISSALNDVRQKLTD